MAIAESELQLEVHRNGLCARLLARARLLCFAALQ